MKVKQCVTCEYFQKSEQKNQGTCRVNPPTATGIVSYWPQVTIDDWCSRWLQRSEP